MPLDDLLFRLIHHRAGSWPLLDRPARGCAQLGSYAELALMALAGVIGGARGRRAVARCLGAVAAIFLAVELIGLLVRRSRPFADLAGAQALVEHPPDRSFPSRHVASAVAMARIVWPVSGPIGALMGVVAAALAISRVRVGIHYPSDVLAGAGLGLVGARLLGERTPREQL